MRPAGNAPASTNGKFCGADVISGRDEAGDRAGTVAANRITELQPCRCCGVEAGCVGEQFIGRAGKRGQFDAGRRVEDTHSGEPRFVVTTDAADHEAFVVEPAHRGSSGTSAGTAGVGCCRLRTPTRCHPTNHGSPRPSACRPDSIPSRHRPRDGSRGAWTCSDQSTIHSLPLLRISDSVTSIVMTPME